MTSQPEHNALTVSELTVGYTNRKSKHAVASNISFDLKPGELAAIVGGNGIGKSTLLRTLGRLQTALSGSIELSDQPLEQFSAQQLATQISVVLTEPIASLNLSVWELIALGRQPYTSWNGKLAEEDRERVANCMDQLALGPLQDKKCYQLSDGQLQRALIARALAQDTPLMLLDEPTSHLDLYHRTQILQVLQEIAHNNEKTILLTSHEISLCLQLCDALLVMQQDGNTFGSPASLVASGIFETLFPDKTIVFDAENLSFKYRNPSH